MPISDNADIRCLSSCFRSAAAREFAISELIIYVLQSVTTRRGRGVPIFGSQAQMSEVLIRYAAGIDERDSAKLFRKWTDDIDADYGRLEPLRRIDHDVIGDEHQDMGPVAQPDVELRHRHRRGPG